jgi:hypothetical protein
MFIRDNKKRGTTGMAVSRTLESAQATGSLTSVLTINLSRECGRYSPTKGTFIDIMPKVGIEPTIP